MATSGRRRLFIHIGQAKTGSTSIQTMLHRLSPSLEQLGVHVVATAEILGNHGRLAIPRAHENPSGFGGLDERWQALFAELTRCGASGYLVSAEEFSNPRGRMGSVECFAALAAAARLDVEVIACVRPQCQWLEASWAQRVWGGEALPPFADGLEENLHDLRLDYARLFAPWREAFGRVTVIPLERSRLPDGLLARFLDILEIDDARAVAAAKRLPQFNRRHGAKSLEIRRLTGVLLGRHGWPHWRRAQAMNRLRGLSGLLDDDPPFAGRD